MPLGWFYEGTYEEEAILMMPGDLLIIYTDGFTEVMNDNGELFGENRLYQVIREHRHLAPAKIVEELDNAITQFESASSEYRDDRTIVVIKVNR